MEEPSTASVSTAGVLTAIPTKAFHNRRYQSPYLKKLFPAGFQVQQVRHELLLDPIEKEYSSQVMHNSSSLNTSVSVRPSFVNWTKGVESEDSFQDSEIDDDPYGDCAGPTLKELNALRRANDFTMLSSEPFIDDPACRVNRCRLYPVNKNTRSPNRKHLQKGPVYHAPASLPTLTPVLANTKAAEAYDKWLWDRRNKIPEKVWTIKGNNDTINYSTIGSSSGSLLNAGNELAGSMVESHLTHQASVVTAIPELIHVEIHTSNQIIRARSIADHAAHYSYKVFQSNSSLEQMKRDIVQDIVKSIQHAFGNDVLPERPHLDSVTTQHSAPSNHSTASNPSSSSKLGQVNDSSFDSLGHLNSSKSLGDRSASMNSLLSRNTNISVSMSEIDLVLHYYDWQLGTWRPLQEEKDWIFAKYLVAQNTSVRAHSHGSADSFGQHVPNLKIMYALEPKSEHYLLREIEGFYEKKKEQMALAKQHFSIQSLTDALNNNSRKFNYHLPSSQKPSLVRTHPRESSVKSSAGEIRPLLSTQSSLLYPKANPRLKALQDDAKKTEMKYEMIARNLEQQILKTKW